MVLFSQGHTNIIVLAEGTSFQKRFSKAKQFIEKTKYGTNTFLSPIKI